MSRNGKGAFRKVLAKAAADAPKAPRAPRLRRLTDDEIELWLSVAAGVTPRPDTLMPLRVALAVSETEAPPVMLKIAAAPLAVPPPVAKAKLPPLAPLDRKLKQKLSRGRMTADAAIDLHGYRQAEAYSALQQFLHRAQRDGARVVLVVTGKGGRPGYASTGDVAPIGAGEGGVLKRAVPIWLGQPEFRLVVVGYEQAAQPHGGSGALYVRLRRRQEP